MLGDKRLEVRSRAMQMVREARARRRPGPVRHFRVHGLAGNVSARHFTYTRTMWTRPILSRPLSVHSDKKSER